MYLCQKLLTVHTDRNWDTRRDKPRVLILFSGRRVEREGVGTGHLFSGDPETVTGVPLDDGRLKDKNIRKRRRIKKTKQQETSKYQEEVIG